MQAVLLFNLRNNYVLNSYLCSHKFALAIAHKTDKFYEAQTNFTFCNVCMYICTYTMAHETFNIYCVERRNIKQMLEQVNILWLWLFLNLNVEKEIHKLCMY